MLVLEACSFNAVHSCASEDSRAGMGTGVQWYILTFMRRRDHSDLV